MTIPTIPHPELTPIQGIPTKTTLVIMQRELNANGEAMPTIDNAPNGHLGVIMPVAESRPKTTVSHTLRPCSRPTQVNLQEAMLLWKKPNAFTNVL